MIKTALMIAMLAGASGEGNTFELDKGAPGIENVVCASLCDYDKDYSSETYSIDNWERYVHVPEKIKPAVQVNKFLDEPIDKSRYQKTSCDTSEEFERFDVEVGPWKVEGYKLGKYPNKYMALATQTMEGLRPEVPVEEFPEDPFEKLEYLKNWVVEKNLNYVRKYPWPSKHQHYSNHPLDTLKYGGECTDQTVLVSAIMKLIDLKPGAYATQGHIFPGVWLDKEYVLKHLPNIKEGYLEEPTYNKKNGEMFIPFDTTSLKLSTSSLKGFIMDTINYGMGSPQLFGKTMTDENCNDRLGHIQDKYRDNFFEI